MTHCTKKLKPSRGVLRNFTKFTGKQLCQSLFPNTVAGLGPATLLKKRLATLLKNTGGTGVFL